MRNLTLSNYESFCLKNLQNCEAFCFDKLALYAYDRGKIYKRSLNDEEIVLDLTNNLYPAVDDSDIPKALDICSFCEDASLYIILFNGDIVTLREGAAEPEIVGSVDGGIKAAQWSPDKEVIALVTGNDTVILMTNNFDPLSEVNLHGDDFGEKQFITVGWGKKETQFRGSEGKFNANEKKKEIEILTENNSDIKISWRGDGEYFVVSSINPNTSSRYLRIFSRSGILQYTSEELRGLQQPIDWSSGNLIASSQVFPNKYNICFFEKNGLKHGEFKLPENYPDIIVNQLLWSKNSKMLALLISNSSSDSKSKRYIQLYTVSNYHWYCKYTINFQFDSVPLQMQWDSYKNNTLHIIIMRGDEIYHDKYSWLWAVHKSKGKTLQDKSLVAVIDGCKLKLTSFSMGIIPPPMCSYEISTPYSINSVSFAPDLQGKFSSNDICVHLSDNSLLIFKHSDSNKTNYQLVCRIQNLFEDFETCLNIQWADAETIILNTVKLVEDESKPFLTVLKINYDNLNESFRVDEIELKSPVAIIRASNSVILFSDNLGQLFSFSLGKRKLENLNSNKESLIDLEIKDKENGGFSFFSLDNSNRFCINGSSVVLNNVLSFHVHDNFILLTTMKNELVCLNAENDIESLNMSQVYSRRVERGSRIITSVKKDMKLILQMPRGNLECVQPRPLSLFVVGKFLDSLDYFSAFDLMRKQRINLNLLYDHNPDLFSRNIHLFLQQIKDLQWISLFLSDLTNKNITKTMYSSIYTSANTENNSFDNKIDIVCGLFERTFTQLTDSDRFVLPLLTCYIKRGRIEYLEKALLKLKELSGKEQSGCKIPVSFHEAFKYTLYLIDVEELYNVALGMYDFDLVVLIASKSQKDPKEYFQFLNEIKQLEPNYQKFTIDKYLKRYEKALSHLIKCEDLFDECMNFIQTHKLYKPALKLMSGNTERYKKFCVCYGDELMKAHSYEEAGIIYMNSGRYDFALNAYRKSGNWQEVLFCAKELKLSESELKELYSELAFELFETKLFKEAATVYLDYLNDVPECLRALSRGKLFAEAYRIAYLHQSPYLIMQIVIPEILEQTNHMQWFVKNTMEQFIAQKNRLKVVRKEKKEQVEHDWDDLQSDTSTVITQSSAVTRTTNRTYRSAKNRRKQERKLLSLKEGSPFEEFALIASLHDIVKNCTSHKLEIKELNKFLIKIGEWEKAKNLQEKFSDLLKIIAESKSEIWVPDMLNNKLSYGPETTSNEISSMFGRLEQSQQGFINAKCAAPPDTEDNVKWKLDFLDV